MNLITEYDYNTYCSLHNVLEGKTIHFSHSVLRQFSHPLLPRDEFMQLRQWLIDDATTEPEGPDELERRMLQYHNHCSITLFYEFKRYSKIHQAIAEE